jgi:hypothetical protein
MKHIKSMVTVTLTALILFLVAPATFAGNGLGPGDGSGPVCSNIMDGTSIEVSGVVESIGTRGMGIGIDTGSEIVTVFGMGPIAFWNLTGIARPEVGEQIVVNGYEITFSDGSTKIVAFSVIVDDQEIILRDATSGVPLWRGIAGGQGSGGNGSGGQGQCCGLRDGSCLQ